MGASGLFGLRAPIVLLALGVMIFSGTLYVMALTDLRWLGMVNAEEYALLQKRDELRDKVVHVDDFPFDYDVTTAAQRHVSATHTVAREVAGLAL